jgi:DNA-binding NarL/FixJ family response regulator
MSTDPSSPSLAPAVLISNNQLLLLGLQTVLSHVVSLTMAPNKGGFDKVIQQARPQLIIFDMEPYTKAVEMIQMVKDTVPRTRILLLAGVETIEGTVTAPESGVDGVVLRTQPPEVLLAAVTVLIHSPMATGAAALNGHGLPRPYVAVWPTSLIPREREIVQCVSQGQSNKEVADRLGISAITVRHHLTSIFSKLGVAGRQKLIIQAHQNGMVYPISSDMV